ncbi:cbb3-type cytochrome oxidase assembly protein CcoS [Fulvivirgaceae bacterium BMA10]|uniref:Cbb3-type cytochrome oxidase assembly protein CcoS n=1 Tax=Splendidivirga corallicola TaxID=3051826 RepID=A0ABT8KXB5_9BACT|nr:cbb3-type cytochrome oxidase assembly protein CcoS [Fulvivirgaceae bacterium BMA10]
MSVIFILIFLSLIVAVVFLYLFYRAVKSGQYDDTYTPSVRILFDDKKPDGPKREKKKSKKEKPNSSKT